MGIYSVFFSVLAHSAMGYRRIYLPFTPPLARFVPYEEDFAEELEDHFRQAMTTGSWHQRLEFPSGEIIVMHSPHAMVHFMPNR